MKIKSNYIYLTVIFFLVFLIGYMSRCKGRETVKPSVTHDRNVILSHEINQIDSTAFHIAKRLKQDSINQKLAYGRLLNKYHKAILQAPDTCRSWIDTVCGEALILDLTDNVTIKRQDSLIDQKDIEISKLKQVVKNDSTAMKDIYKARFWKGYIKGFGHGTLFGIAADESARAGIRMIKP